MFLLLHMANSNYCWSTRTLTVYRDRDILEPDDYEYFLYEKEGGYRRYLRDMKDETDY